MSQATQESGADNAPVTDHAHADQALAEIEKGQHLAGHFPDADALERARRVLEGRTTLDEAIAEIDRMLFLETGFHRQG